MLSVVTCSYNQGQYLGACIESILANDSPLEYIIMDGASNDNSIDVIKSYDKGRFSWESKPDRGQVDALNMGLMRTNGTIMGWINSDDMLCPNVTQTIQDFFENDEVNWITGNCEFIDRNGKSLGIMIPEIPSTFHEWINLLVRGKSYPIFQPSTFWRKEVWEACGPLDRSLDYSFDHDFFLKIYQKFGPPTYVNSILSRFRIHDHSKTNNFGLRFEKENRKIGLRNLNNLSLRQQIKLRLISLLTLSHRVARLKATV